MSPTHLLKRLKVHPVGRWVGRLPGVNRGGRPVVGVGVGYNRTADRVEFHIEERCARWDSLSTQKENHSCQNGPRRARRPWSC